MRPCVCVCARTRPVHVCARPVASKIHASCVGYVHLAVDVHNSFCLEYLRRRGGGPSPSPPVPRRRVTQVSHLTSNKSSPGTSEISLNRLTENGVAPDATGVGRITRRRIADLVGVSSFRVAHRRLWSFRLLVPPSSGSGTTLAMRSSSRMIDTRARIATSRKRRVPPCRWKLWARDSRDDREKDAKSVRGRCAHRVYPPRNGVTIRE